FARVARLARCDAEIKVEARIPQLIRMFLGQRVGFRRLTGFQQLLDVVRRRSQNGLRREANDSRNHQATPPHGQPAVFIVLHTDAPRMSYSSNPRSLERRST